jgi:hypothetical protein
MAYRRFENSKEKKGFCFCWKLQGHTEHVEKKNLKIKRVLMSNTRLSSTDGGF